MITITSIIIIENDDNIDDIHYGSRRRSGESRGSSSTDSSDYSSREATPSIIR